MAVDIGLRNVQRLDLEERMEYRMREIEVDEPALGQRVLHVVFEGLPAASPAEVSPLEVVDDEKSALVQVVAKGTRLTVGHLPPVGLDHVGDRILTQLRIVEPETV